MTYVILFGRFSVLDSPSKFTFRFSTWKTAGAWVCECVWSVDSLFRRYFLYERMWKTMSDDVLFCCFALKRRGWWDWMKNHLATCYCDSLWLFLDLHNQSYLYCKPYEFMMVLLLICTYHIADDLNDLRKYENVRLCTNGISKC